MDKDTEAIICHAQTSIVQTAKAAAAILATWAAAAAEWFFNAGGASKIITVSATITSIMGLAYMYQGIQLRRQIINQNERNRHESN